VIERTTIAVAERIRRDGFAGPGWGERWDIAFADLYLDALEAALQAPRPGPAEAGRVRLPG
jgi:Family of unknown function (DUF5995)